MFFVFFYYIIFVLLVFCLFVFVCHLRFFRFFICSGVCFFIKFVFCFPCYFFVFFCLPVLYIPSHHQTRPYFGYFKDPLRTLRAGFSGCIFKILGAKEGGGG